MSGGYHPVERGKMARDAADAESRENKMELVYAKR
jgi:hypothetical protein